MTERQHISCAEPHPTPTTTPSCTQGSLSHSGTRPFTASLLRAYTVWPSKQHAQLTEESTLTAILPEMRCIGPASCCSRCACGPDGKQHKADKTVDVKQATNICEAEAATNNTGDNVGPMAFRLKGQNKMRDKRSDIECPGAMLENTLAVCEQTVSTVR